MIEGIELLIEEQVDIINMSMGDEYKYHKEIEEVCKTATEMGILIVAAYSNQKAEATYPASFHFVMGVRCMDMENPVQVFQYDGIGTDVIFSSTFFSLYRIEEPLEQRFIREVTRTERCDTFESGMEKLRNKKTAEQHPVLFIDHNNYQEICEYKERIRGYAMEHPETEIVLRHPLFNMVERLDFQKKTNRNLNQFTV